GEVPRMRRVAGYVFGQLARLERSSRTRVLLVMDAPRTAIYDGRDPSTTDAFRMNEIAARASAEAGVTLLDLTRDFERDFREHGTRFEFPHDGHWNARAHGIAAEAVCGALEAELGEARIRCGKYSDP
ncbi:MAG: hypothetical protein ACREQ9_07735, partial [Candidatus Binatia bacterium]